jgi:hypothetical protein
MTPYICELSLLEKMRERERGGILCQLPMGGDRIPFKLTGSKGPFHF